MRPLREPTAAGTVQSVSRALQALELVAARRDGATAREVAAHLDLALPSAYHLLATLTASGYLVHLAQEHRYGLGYRVQLLEQGLTRQLEVPAPVATAIARLHHDADAAAYYAVYRDVGVVVAHVVDSASPPAGADPRRRLPRGHARHRVRQGPAGRHGQRPARALPHLGRPAPPDRLTPSPTAPSWSGTSPASSQSSIALEVNEFQDGLACLASPVRSRAGAVVGSVAISLPAPELLARRGQLERVVRHGAKVVTHAVSAASRTSGGRP